MPNPKPNPHHHRRRRPSSRSPRPLPPPAPRRLPEHPSPLRRRPRGAAPLRRISSEPELPTPGFDWDGGEGSSRSPSFPRFLTFSDVCSPASPSASPWPPSLVEGRRGEYLDSLKVLVNVTVEESPGPIRILVRLNATVAEIINDVLIQYSKEGRSPPLGLANAASFQFYYSYFSLEGLDESKKFGDVGGRSFFLRRKGGQMMESGHGEVVGLGLESNGVASWFWGANMMLSFMARRLSKIGRSVRKIWKIMGCMA